MSRSKTNGKRESVFFKQLGAMIYFEKGTNCVSTTRGNQGISELKSRNRIRIQIPLLRTLVKVVLGKKIDAHFACEVVLMQVNSWERNK